MNPGIKREVDIDFGQKQKRVNHGIIDLCGESSDEEYPGGSNRHEVIVISDCDEEADPRHEVFQPSGLVGLTSHSAIHPLNHHVAGMQPTINMCFSSFDQAKHAVYSHQNSLGYRWKIHQSKEGPDGLRKKVTLRCNSSYIHKEIHIESLDPLERRQGKTCKRGCHARVNLN